MKTICLILALVVTIPFSIQAQNLILNPGCEDTLIGGNIPHWLELAGANWTQRNASPEPQAGTSYFFPGVAATAELGQVIDVANDSAAIDNGTKIYYFTGYVRAYEQSPPDESNIFIYFRNGGDSILTSFILGPYTQTQTWLRIDSALSAPPGSREVDIRLHSVRHNGSNNDGYYDELYLGNSPLVEVPEVARKQDFLIYPNPSHGQFTFEFSLSKQSDVKLVLLNSLGQVAATLADGIYPAGLQRISWNSGNLPEGIYYLRVHMGAISGIQKLIINDNFYKQ
jgi:hypothetical protein